MPQREPSMQRAWEKLKDQNFMIFAVKVGEDEDTVFAFTFETGVELEFQILLDIKGEVIQSWRVLGLPTTFIVDTEGRIAYRAIGGRDWHDPRLLQIIVKLMEEGKTKSWSDQSEGQEVIRSSAR